MEQICMQLAKFYDEKVAEVEDVRKVSASKEDFIEKSSTEIYRLRKEIGNQAKLMKHQKEEHAKAIEQVILDTKKSEMTVVYEARLKMVNEADVIGYDVSIWEAQLWKTMLDTLKSKDLEGDDEAGATTSTFLEKSIKQEAGVHY